MATRARTSAQEWTATAADGTRLRVIAVNRQRDGKIVDSWVITAAT